MATRLGQEEGIPADNLKVSSTVTSGTSSAADGAQLSAIAGARRSRGSEPRATVFSTSSQKASYYEKFRKIVRDSYAQYTALGRKQSKQQEEETELWEGQKKQQQEELEEQQAETTAAETARQETLTETQKQQAEAEKKALADQYAKSLAEKQRQYDAAEKLLAEESEAAKAAQDEYEKTQTAQLNAQTAAQKKQMEEYYASLEAEQKKSQEETKAYYRGNYEDLIDDQRKTYMQGMAQVDPNAMLEYDEEKAKEVWDEEYYMGTIPDMPEELLPEDTTNYNYTTKLTNLEDYLVAYEDNFSNTTPALTPIFWQIDPKYRQGYIDAYNYEMNGPSSPEDVGMGRQDYLQAIGFTPDESKPLIKEKANLIDTRYDYNATLRNADSHYTAPSGSSTSSGTAATGGTTATAAQRTYDQARVRYLEDNPDVARAGMDPWVHYSMYGKNEGRAWPGATNPGGGGSASTGSSSTGSSGGGSSQPSVNVNLTYDQAAAQYLNENDDVREAGIDPWTHYITWGKNEGRAWRGAAKDASSGTSSGGTGATETQDWWNNFFNSFGGGE